MPRPKLSERTKGCRQDLRVLALWRLGDRQKVDRAGLVLWLAGSVDAGWGREDRPADLGAPEEETNAVITCWPC
jgi:hypothetical protein